MAFTKEQFEAVKIGSTVGVVDGPGQSPKDRTATVKEKVETRWGYHLVCEWTDKEQREAAGETATCHGFTKVGIGWYFMEGPKT